MNLTPFPFSCRAPFGQELYLQLARINEDASKKKRGPQKKIRQQLEQIETLPMVKQRAIAQLLDSVLAANQ